MFYQVAGVGICTLMNESEKIMTFQPIVRTGDNLSSIRVNRNSDKYRELIDQEEAKKLQLRLSSPEKKSVSFKSNWRKREKLYQQKYTSLDPWQILDIVEELLDYEQEKKLKKKYLTHMEKLWLNQSIKILEEEIKVVLDGKENVDVLCKEEPYSA